MAATSKIGAGIGKEVLLTEYARLCSDVRSIESTNEKLLGFGFTLISLAAVAGLYQHVYQVFFLLPVSVVGTLAYVAASYNALYSMAGYKRHLEDLLNEAVGEPLLLWESIAERRERRSINSALLFVVYFLVSTTICALSIERIIHKYSLLIGVPVLIGTVVLFFVLWLGIRQMQSTKDETYHQAQRLWRSRQGKGS